MNHLMLFGGFLVPLLVICVSYTCLVIELKSRRLNLNECEMDSLSQYSNENERKRHFSEIQRLNANEPSITKKDETIFFKTPSNHSCSSSSSKSFKKPASKINRSYSGKSSRLTQSIRSIQNKTTENIYSVCEAKAIKTGIISVIVFCLAWLPYSVITFAAQYFNNREYFVNPITTCISSFLAKFSTVLNPFLYIISNKRLIFRLRNSIKKRKKSTK